jgi:MFS family permease
MFLALRRRAQGLERVIPVGVFLLGSGLIGLSFSKTLALSLPLLGLIGVGTMTMVAATNTSLQNMVDDDKRGRVMSFYTMAFMGMGPFGSLLAGGLASKLGASWAVALNGTACIIAATLFYLFSPPFTKTVT